MQNSHSFDNSQSGGDTKSMSIVDRVAEYSTRRDDGFFSSKFTIHSPEAVLLSGCVGRKITHTGDWYSNTLYMMTFDQIRVR